MQRIMRWSLLLVGVTAVLAVVLAMAGVGNGLVTVDAQESGGSDPSPEPTSTPLTYLQPETSTATATWGTVTLQTGGSWEPPRATVTTRSSPAVRPRPQLRPRTYTGRIVMSLDKTDWLSSPDYTAISKYRIERRHHFPGDASPSGFQHVTEVAINAVGNVTTYTDDAVAAWSTYSYSITPVTATGITLEAGSVGQLTAVDRWGVSGYGTSTGAKILVAPVVRVPLEHLRIKLIRTAYDETFTSTVVGNKFPASENLEGQRVPFDDVVSDSGGTLGTEYMYSVEYYENIPGSPERKLPYVPVGDSVYTGVYVPGVVQGVDANVDSGQNLRVTWTKYGAYSDNDRVIQFEVLRRAATPGNTDDYEIIGTSVSTSFTDSKAPVDGVYDYQVRAMTEHIPPQRTPVSRLASGPDPVCGTNGNADRFDVSEIQAERNLFRTRGWSEKDANFVDAWFYALDDEGVSRRCHEIDEDAFFLTRETQYVHKVDADKCALATTACTILDVSNGDIPDVTHAIQNQRFSLGTHHWFRYTDENFFSDPGTYGFRYKVCSLAKRSLCSVWVDVTSREFTFPLGSPAQGPNHPAPL